MTRQITEAPSHPTQMPAGARSSAPPPRHVWFDTGDTAYFSTRKQRSVFVALLARQPTMAPSHPSELPVGERYSAPPRRHVPLDTWDRTHVAARKQRSVFGALLTRQPTRAPSHPSHMPVGARTSSPPRRHVGFNMGDRTYVSTRGESSGFSALLTRQLKEAPSHVSQMPVGERSSRLPGRQYFFQRRDRFSVSNSNGCTVYSGPPNAVDGRQRATSGASSGV